MGATAQADSFAEEIYRGKCLCHFIRDPQKTFRRIRRNLHRTTQLAQTTHLQSRQLLSLEWPEGRSPANPYRHIV